MADEGRSQLDPGLADSPTWARCLACGGECRQHSFVELQCHLMAAVPGSGSRWGEACFSSFVKDGLIVAHCDCFHHSQISYSTKISHLSSVLCRMEKALRAAVASRASVGSEVSHIGRVGPKQIKLVAGTAFVLRFRAWSMRLSSLSCLLEVARFVCGTR